MPEQRFGEGELLLKVKACAVCRTDLHIIDGDLPWLGRPVIPGHEIVAQVMALGAGVTGFAPGAICRPSRTATSPPTPSALSGRRSLRLPQRQRGWTI